MPTVLGAQMALRSGTPIFGMSPGELFDIQQAAGIESRFSRAPANVNDTVTPRGVSFEDAFRRRLIEARLRKLEGGLTGTSADSSTPAPNPVDEARAEEQRLQASKKGRSANILTGQRGLDDTVIFAEPSALSDPLGGTTFRRPRASALFG